MGQWSWASLQHPEAQGQLPFIYLQHALESSWGMAHCSEVNGRQVNRAEWCPGMSLSQIRAATEDL